MKLYIITNNIVNIQIESYMVIVSSVQDIYVTIKARLLDKAKLY